MHCIPEGGHVGQHCPSAGGMGLGHSGRAHKTAAQIGGRVTGRMLIHCPAQIHTYIE